MLALSSIIACLSLLGIAVFVLHSYQLRAASNSAERSIPLMANGNDLDLQSIEIDDAYAPIPTKNDKVDEKSLRFLKSIDPESLFVPSPPSVSIKSRPETENLASFEKTNNGPDPSRKQLPQYPLLGAYNQCCVELRQRLKTISANPQLLDTTLRGLYRTAAIAELLHSKTSEGKLSLGQLKMLPDEVIEELDMPYSKLGYSELRLLRKNDIKRMLLLWGKPEIQQCPRIYHSRRWQEICHRYG